MPLPPQTQNAKRLVSEVSIGEAVDWAETCFCEALSEAYSLGKIGIGLSEILLGLGNLIVKSPTVPQPALFNYEFLSVVRDFQNKIDLLFSELEQTHYRTLLTPKEYLTYFGPGGLEQENKMTRFPQGWQNIKNLWGSRPVFFTTRPYELISGYLPDIGLVGIVDEVFTSSIGNDGGLFNSEDVDSIVDLALLDDAFEFLVEILLDGSFFYSWVEYKGKTEYVSDSLLFSIPRWGAYSLADNALLFGGTTVSWLTSLLHYYIFSYVTVVRGALRQVLFLDTEKYLRGGFGRSDVWKNLHEMVSKTSSLKTGGPSGILHLLSRFALNLPQLNYILADGHVGTFEEIQNLNKQALFALRFQRTPEDIITFSSENPNIEDFATGGRVSIS